jgi:hypothetical protein
MRSLFYFLVITLFGLFSCNPQNRETIKDNKISIIGKWHRFSMANGYTEFDIDSQQVVFFNQKVGRFKLPYKIENDSLKYLTNPYVAKVTNYGDSIFLEGNDNTTATLFRFKKPNIPFTNIPEEKDSISFVSYVNGFDKRLIREFEKVGITISANTEESDDATYQQLLKKKIINGDEIQSDH